MCCKEQSTTYYLRRTLSLSHIVDASCIPCATCCHRPLQVVMHAPTVAIAHGKFPYVHPLFPLPSSLPAAGMMPTCIPLFHAAMHAPPAAIPRCKLSCMCLLGTVPAASCHARCRKPPDLLVYLGPSCPRQERHFCGGQAGKGQS